jgi:CheY-like chemotaxis protein
LAAVDTVVIVDDDEGVREAIADVLALDGYAVLTAHDGEQALEVLRGAPRPCVALIDLIMPRVNGWELVRTVLDDAAYRGIGVICCTAGRAEPPEGCAVVLRKPFDETALTAAIARAFGTVR